MLPNRFVEIKWQAIGQNLVGDEIVRAFGVLEAGDVGETNEILLALRKHRD